MDGFQPVKIGGSVWPFATTKAAPATSRSDIDESCAGSAGGELICMSRGINVSPHPTLWIHCRKRATALTWPEIICSAHKLGPIFPYGRLATRFLSAC